MSRHRPIGRTPNSAGGGRRRACPRHRHLTALLFALLPVISSCTGQSSRAANGPTTEASAPTPTGAITTYRRADCPFAQARHRRRRDASASTPTVECGYLSVPERRDRGDGRRVELAVAVVRSTATAPARDPVVYLEGGPGGSALASIELWTSPPSPLLADRDVILLDQRGTGYSTPRLSCDEELDAAGDDTRPSDELTRACWNRLTAAGVDPDAYSTGESAADVADLRVALGISSWNLFGVSYGTRLALRVMHDHPEGVRAVVLDSVYPPDVHGIDDEPRNAAAAIGAVLDRCRDDHECSHAFPDLRARFFAAVDRLDASPAQIDETDPDTGETYPGTITGGDLVDASFDTLYDTSALPSLPHALDLAANGRVQDALDVIADPPSARRAPAGPATEPPPSEQRPDDSDGLFLSIECAEEAPKNSRAGVASRSATLDEPLRRTLEPEADDLFTSCDSWPVRPKPPPTTQSDISTLVLAGGLDPITPPAWADQAARGLSHSTVRVFPDAGHAVLDAGPCAQAVIVSFLRAPSAPADPCTPEPIRFDLG